MIVSTSNSVRDSRRTSVNNLFETYKSFAINKENLNGDIELVFIERMARLLDDVILNNNLDVLSKEQLLMFKRYLTEADTGLVSKDLIQLDEFLGGL